MVLHDILGNLLTLFKLRNVLNIFAASDCLRLNFHHPHSFVLQLWFLLDIGIQCWHHAIYVFEFLKKIVVRTTETLLTVEYLWGDHPSECLHITIFRFGDSTVRVQTDYIKNANHQIATNLTIVVCAVDPLTLFVVRGGEVIGSLFVVRVWLFCWLIWLISTIVATLDSVRMDYVGDSMSNYSATTLLRLNVLLVLSNHLVLGKITVLILKIHIINAHGSTKCLGFDLPDEIL